MSSCDDYYMSVYPLVFILLALHLGVVPRGAGCLGQLGGCLSISPWGVSIVCLHNNSTKLLTTLYQDNKTLNTLNDTPPSGAVN